MLFLTINQKNEITSIHHCPFDPEYGLGKTEEELKKVGVLVDEIPEPENITGKSSILKWSGTSLYYEYADRPLTADEIASQLADENTTLQSAVTEMTEYIAIQDTRLAEQEERLATQENAITELSTLIATGGM